MRWSSSLASLAACSLVAACSDPAPAPSPDAPLPPATVATGELGPWQPAPALPTARANHCSTSIDDWLVVVGGNRKQGDGFVKTDEIHVARVGADGTLGAWQLAGRTPSPVTECTATSNGRTLYIVDGLYDRATDARQVLAATLDDTGLLGALAPMATLPAIAISSEATAHGDHLLMMDTVLPDEGDQTVTLRVPFTGGTWTTHDWQIGFRAQAQYAFTARFAYTLGGYTSGDGNPVSDEVFVTAIADDGSVGPARATTRLPAPVAFGEAIAVDDYVFVVGGRAQVFGGTATTAVFAGQVQADGSIAAWTELAALPVARTNHELAVAGDHLVVTGGAGAAGGDATVLVARVRF